MTHRVLLGLGSNVGNRAETLRHALVAVGEVGSVCATSFLYRTKAMYVENQPDFYNAACEISTALPPLALLHRLKDIERRFGREVNEQRYGPRPLDIDILLYGDERIEIEKELVVPHERIAEREFVLRPLRDIDEPEGRIQIRGESVRGLLEALMSSRGAEAPADYRADDSAARRIMPLRWAQRELQWSTRTFGMAIINLDPNSFSDGGDIRSVEDAARAAAAALRAGADIVDVSVREITFFGARVMSQYATTEAPLRPPVEYGCHAKIGGQSTRPQAELLSEEEELEHVARHTASPLATVLASLASDLRREVGAELAISVDTFRASVAKQAVSCGADIVNDVSGGRADAAMLRTVAELGTGCPYVVMHSRGGPSTMDSLARYDDVVGDAAAELNERTEAAMRAGVARWNIIIDAGFGFAKNAEHNLALLRRLKEWKNLCGGFPLLVGVSRKRFLGGMLGGRPARARDWATAGAAAMCAASGAADIVRVHNTNVLDALRVVDCVRGAVLE